MSVAVPVVVDAERAVKDWINGQGALADRNNPQAPLKGGAQFKRLDAVRSTYAYVRLIANSTGELAEVPLQMARVSATVYGPTQELAMAGAAALANALWAVILAARFPVPMSRGIQCMKIDNVTGPLPIDDYETTREQFRYLVDADYYLAPV